MIVRKSLAENGSEDVIDDRFFPIAARLHGGVVEINAS